MRRRISTRLSLLDGPACYDLWWGKVMRQDGRDEQMPARG
jgi:hypothetical protein